MKVLRIQDAPKVPFNLDGHLLHQSDYFDLVHLSLKPGESVEAHINPLPVVLFGLGGEAVIGIGNESDILRAGTYLKVDANLSRYLVNRNNEPFKMLVIKYRNPG